MKKLASRFKLQASRKSEMAQEHSRLVARSSQHHTGTPIFLSRNIGKKNWSLAANERGFTLLLSALIVSIVLAIGASISGLAQKELTLSSIGRDSQFAFYTADSGAECALYWDVRHQIFSVENPPDKLKCGGQEASITTESNPPSTNFRFRYDSNGYCADVLVSKSPSGSGSFFTDIRADGFSANCDGIATNPRVLQRSVELHY